MTTTDKLSWYTERITEAQALREKYIVANLPACAAVAQEEVARLMAEKAMIQQAAKAKAEAK